MGLETGTYISDLNPNNPVNATDVVGEGDDHLRLIKSTILNSFPGITGELSLTQDQLNDAAIKSEANTFTSVAAFNAGIQSESYLRMGNAQEILGRNAADTTSLRIGRLDTSDRLEFGQDTGVVEILARSLGSQRHYVNSLQVALFTERASGSLQIADASGTLGNVAAVHKEQTFTAVQTFDKQTTFNLQQQLANDIPITGRNAANTAWRALVRLDSSDNVRVGENTINTWLFGNTQISAYINGQENARVIARGSGSLQIADSAGTLGNVAAVHKDQSFSGQNSFSGGITHFDVGTNFAQFARSGLNASQRLEVGQDGTGHRIIAKSLSSSPKSIFIEIDDEGANTAGCYFQVNSERVAFARPRADGSFSVYDRAGNLKKAGFRNPSINGLPLPRTTNQDDEGTIIQITATGTLSLGQLEVGTTYRLLVTNGTLTVDRGTNTTLRWLDGSGTLKTVTSVTVQTGSIVEVFHATTSAAYVFGNGIS